VPLLTVDQLEVRYGHIRGTDNVSFSVDAGEIFALVGSNGAGKSSTLKAILGMVSYRQGDITFEGRKLAGLKPSEIIRLGIGFSPEGRRVFPQLTVQDNLRMGGYVCESSDEIAQRMDNVFRYFPRLRERARQLAGSLSGGEQQMLAIGRALMSKPKLFLLDEPSLGLAPIIVETIGEVLQEIKAREGLSVILAEQNANWALGLATRAVVLELGRTTLAGASGDLLSDARIQSAYLGV
jgi:branched-chain amino acid transport system ATP-binding protein